MKRVVWKVSGTDDFHDFVTPEIVCQAPTGVFIHSFVTDLSIDAFSSSAIYTSTRQLFTYLAAIAYGDRQHVHAFFSIHRVFLGWHK